MVIPSEFSMGQYTDDHLRENALQFNISFRLLIFFSIRKEGTTTRRSTTQRHQHYDVTNNVGLTSLPPCQIVFSGC